MKKLCVGVNGSLEEIKNLVNSFDCIKTIYTSDYIKNTTGGRKGGIIQNIEQIKEIADFLKSKDVEYFITNNQTVCINKRADREFWAQYKDHILGLEEIGVDGLVAGHPFYIDFIKRNSKLKVCVSTTAEISTVRAAKYFEDIGADMICPSYSINYDMKVLTDMKNSLNHATIKLLVNEFCLGGCIYRRYHQNSYVSDSNLDTDYGFTCHKIVLSNPATILQNNTVRPEDLKHYFHITDNFKISLREPPFKTEEGNYEVVKAYAEECFKGNYMSLISQHFSSLVQIPNEKLDTLYDLKQNCDKNCTVCDECENVYTAAVQAV